MKDRVNVSIGLQYTNSYSENIISFVNNVKTPDGGTHEVGFKTAITKVLNDYAKENGVDIDSLPSEGVKTEIQQSSNNTASTQSTINESVQSSSINPRYSDIDG